HDVVIPVSVLEELDSFKSGSDTINYNARDFLRSLDEISDNKLFDGGIDIGPGKGKLKVVLEQQTQQVIKDNFPSSKVDHRILNTALYLQKDNPGKEVVLISKDTNLKMKARAVGLKAENLTSDQIKNVDNLYRGVRYEEGVPAEVIDLLYRKPYEIGLDLFHKEEWMANEFLVLRNGKKSALARYVAGRDVVSRVKKDIYTYIDPQNAEQAFAMNALVDPGISLVTLTGKPGTGKTLLSLAAAMEVKSNYRQIFVARPNVPLSNRDMGYLPGDIQEKMDPYMQPIEDNLALIQELAGNKINGNGKPLDIQDMKAKGKIVMSPLSYIRGRSLNKILFIVDEAQNLTRHDIKTIATRAGQNTKVVFTGDIHQIDHPYLDSRSNGVSHIIESFKDQNIFAHVNMERGERSELANLAAELL
ncbi:MAG TPA: PhoH family protein, partial [Patescibacteria group bacterium]|nr:PhoH family protein [Patescibacteria group bacterium]